MRSIYDKETDWIFFDCDDTLVMWRRPNADGSEDDKVINIRFRRQNHPLIPHQPHIDYLKKKHSYGCTIVVWSAGGYKWARAVTKALGLKDYVKHCISKPREYVDDLECREWMGQYGGRAVYMQEKDDTNA